MALDKSIRNHIGTLQEMESVISEASLKNALSVRTRRGYGLA